VIWSANIDKRQRYTGHYSPGLGSPASAYVCGTQYRVDWPASAATNQKLVMFGPAPEPAIIEDIRRGPSPGTRGTAASRTTEDFANTHHANYHRNWSAEQESEGFTAQALALEGQAVGPSDGWLGIVLSDSLGVAQQPPATPTSPSPAQSTPAPVPPAPASTPDQETLRVVPAKRYPGKMHVLPATMETTTWGWFNNAQPPILHVDSGDTIVFETMMHSHNRSVPGTTIEEIKKLRTELSGPGTAYAHRACLYRGCRARAWCSRSAMCQRRCSPAPTR